MQQQTHQKQNATPQRCKKKTTCNFATCKHPNIKDEFCFNIQHLQQPSCELEITNSKHANSILIKAHQFKHATFMCMMHFCSLLRASSDMALKCEFYYVGQTKWQGKGCHQCSQALAYHSACCTDNICRCHMTSTPTY